LQELPDLIEPLAEIKLASTQTLQQDSAKVQESNSFRYRHFLNIGSNIMRPLWLHLSQSGLGYYQVFYSQGLYIG
jgi:hypothetical protein